MDISTILLHSDYPGHYSRLTVAVTEGIWDDMTTHDTHIISALSVDSMSFLMDRVQNRVTLRTVQSSTSRDKSEREVRIET